jgi:carbamoyltransferase
MKKKPDVFKGYIPGVLSNCFGEKVEWDHDGPVATDAADIAFAIQKVTEEAMVGLTKRAFELTGERNLGMAGGVALNAKANMEVYNSGIFNDMFIFPAANDAGSPIGAAAWACEHILGEKMRNEKLKSVYLGVEYSDDTVKEMIAQSKIKAEYIGDDVGALADMIWKGKIGTFYQGRAELGPRALGNRSIIADPTKKETWRTVNRIKGREWWRPLAPSVLEEDAKDYFANPASHEFMILMFRFNEGMDKRVPAVYHVDGTTRPQTVRRSENKNWYELIKAFKERSGEGLIVNTSFNLAGEPLVETPKDAIRSFATAGFDFMYMQGWLLTKK